VARDGNGDYSRAVTPPSNGDVADADDFNTELNDIATALSDSINKNGTKVFAANQPMGGYKLTGLGAGTSNGDSVRFEQLSGYVATSAIGVSVQAFDATLTALAALSWSSGSPLVQFTAADTVSLTLTPSVSSLTASQGASATTSSGVFVNTNDNASVRVLRIEGDRATVTANDEIYVSFFLSDSAGNQDEFFRISAVAQTVTSGAEVGQVNFSTLQAGVFAARMTLGGTFLRPFNNDGMTLGNATLGWADYFGASGHTWNCNNGNVVLTHNNTQAVIEATTGKLVSGLKASTETSGTLTVASRNRVVNCSGGVTLDDGVFATDDWNIFDPGTSARTFTRASGLTMYVNGVDSASATLAANQMGSAYWRSATVVVLAGAFT
jgi:hypothetical protein